MHFGSESQLFGCSILAVCLFSAQGGAAHAQQASVVPEPRFEVASIRPSPESQIPCWSQLPPGTHYIVTCVPLRVLIAQAWRVHPDNVQGGDSQALNVAYGISATVADGKVWSRDNLAPMLRQLLIERFHVTVHAGTKRVPGYILVVAKGGPKLKPSKVDAFQQGFKAGAPFRSFIYDGYIRARGDDLNGIAALLSAQADAPVFDRTGISGAFDVDLHFAKAKDTESEWPPFFIAVEDQLGLKLEPQKVTINTLVVDHVDSSPTPN